jgi:hypothetical protein
MILFLVIFFLIYFIAKVFIFSDYFNKLDGLDKIIFIFLLLFNIWVVLSIYYLYCFLYGFFFITPEKHQFYTDTFIEDFLHNALVPRIYFIISVILIIMFYILLHIFAFWIIILLFVPFIIIIPIPIIPFILPIPLKYLLLIPFQKLTDRGILPLMRRVLFGFISENTTKHLVNSYYNIYDFFYDNLKEMISDFIILNERNNEKISKGLQDNKYRASTIDDENEETSNDIIKTESDNTKLKNKIKEEYLLCVKSKRGMNNFGEDNSMSNTFNNSKNDFECNLDSLKTYMKIKI